MPVIKDPQTTIKDLVENIIPDCDEILIEVGYFYFSGFEEIYKSLENKNIKIIVGMEWDSKISDAVFQSNEMIKNNYFNTLVTDINESDLLESNKSEDSFNIFVKKIKDKSLQIRCIKELNAHQKCYIFKFSDGKTRNGLLPGQVILGSTNLTRSGFVTNIERNHLLTEASDYNDYYEIFQNNWNDAIDIVSDKSFENFKIKVIDKVWLNKIPTPYEVFIKILDSYYTEQNDLDIILPSSFSDGKLINLKYQIDAIKKGIEIIKKHSGVIVADVVGLGKSIIATAIAKNLNLNTIVICPPHLMDAWEDYTTLAQIPKTVISRGRINDALKKEIKTRENLIIIDEAQYYRNDQTVDYLNLHELCKNNKVILLSATPFNNKPQDIFNMTKLFQVPSRSTIQTIDNLSENFKELIKEYNSLKKIITKTPDNLKKIKDKKDLIATEIRSILSPIVIRRSRLDLMQIDRYKKDLDLQGIEFPKRKDPIILEYNLGNLSEIYIETLKIISPTTKDNKYKGARYKSTAYVHKNYLEEVSKRGGYEDKELLLKTLENIADFMKRLMVRRFESSIASFIKTLDSIIKSNEIIKEYFDKLKIVPIYKKGIMNLPDIDDLIDNTEDDISTHIIEEIPELSKFSEKGLWYINENEINDNFYKDLTRDIEILKKLKIDWGQILKRQPVDPKYKILSKALDSELNKADKRKVLIFSEFADTANYIYEKLSNDNYNVLLYSSKINDKKNVKNIVIDNFDANANNAKNDYDVLVATDAISEGYNLNRAGTIFNYDIPYNPTKVIQRFGRINRINKKMYDELYIFNFFPTELGEQEVHTKQISELKISMFQALFGDDTKILNKNEDLESYFADEFNDNEETLNLETNYENLIYNIRENKPKFIEKIRNLPNRIKIQRKTKSYNKKEGLIMYSKKGTDSFFTHTDKSNNSKNIPAEMCFNILDAEPAETACETSDRFETMYKKSKERIYNNITLPSLDRVKKQTIDKIEGIKKICDAKYIEYLENLKKIIEEFDDLPGGHLKKIRNLKKENVNEGLINLQKEISEGYISKIFLNVSKIENVKTKLIISEEINHV